jgi:DNA-binding transcriptional LysR family regulator
VSLSQIDLNLLLALDTVLSERSVVRAARRLHVTPSAVSNALARLRSALGDPLVVRSGRGIVPTPRAARLGPALKQALGELERIVEGDGLDPASVARQFTLAVSDAGQISRVPRLVRVLAENMPRAQLRVVGIDSCLSLGGLGGTEVDVAMTAVVAAVGGTHHMPLYDESSVLVARRSHEHAGRRITKAQLSKLKHVEVQVAPGRGYRNLTRQYAQERIRRDIAVIVPSFVAAAAVASETDLVATLPTSLVDVVGERLALIVLQAPAPKVTTKIMLAWHQRTHDDPAMRAFRELVVR